MMLYPASPEAATRFLKFVNASPTPFHAVQNASIRLEKAGFLKVERSTLHLLLDCKPLSSIRSKKQITGRKMSDLVEDIISQGQSIGQ